MIEKEFLFFIFEIRLISNWCWRNEKTYKEDFWSIATTITTTPNGCFIAFIFLLLHYWKCLDFFSKSNLTFFLVVNNRSFHFFYAENFKLYFPIENVFYLLHLKFDDDYRFFSYIWNMNTYIWWMFVSNILDGFDLVIRLSIWFDSIWLLLLFICMYVRCR